MSASLPPPSCRWPSGPTMLAFGRHELAEPHLRGAQAAVDRVPPDRQAQFAAASAAVGLYEGRFGADPAAALLAAREWLGRGPVLDGDAVAPNLRGLVLTQLGIVEMWTGQLDEAIEHLERAQAVAGEAGIEWTAFAASAHLALASVLRGDFARALRRAHQALAIADRRGWARSEPAGAAYCVLAAVCIQRAQLDEAERLIGQAGAAVRGTRERPLLAFHVLNRAQLLSDRGEHAGALDLLHATREQLGDWPLPAAVDELLTAQEALLDAATGEPEAARALLTPATASSLAVANALARLDLLDDEAAAARATLAAHLDDLDARHGASLPTRAEAWLLDALALDALAEHEAAAQSLERALDLAEPAGLRRMFVAHGGAIEPSCAATSATAPPIPRWSATSWRRSSAAAARPAVPAARRLAEPLSEREQAILGYLPSLMSNQEIAGALMISVNTVKTHLKAIYRKLDAPGRREAVQRARELALIP